MATITAAIGVVQMKHWRKRLDVRYDNAAKLGRAIAEIRRFLRSDYPDYFPSPYLSRRIVFHPDRLGGMTRERLIEASMPRAPESRPRRAGTPRSLTQTASGECSTKHPVFAGNEHGTEDILWRSSVLTLRRSTTRASSSQSPKTRKFPTTRSSCRASLAPADDLIDQYAKAFDKVSTHARRLAEAGV